jgi:hypothetical protein
MTTIKELPEGVHKLPGFDALNPRYVNVLELSRYVAKKNYNFYNRPEDVVISTVAEQIENIDKGKNETVKGSTSVPNHKYERVIRNKYGDSIVVDVYDVLVGFDIKCPAMQHSLKKSLCTGLRGVKGYIQDVDESIESLKRAKELYNSAPTK